MRAKGRSTASMSTRVWICLLITFAAFVPLGHVAAGSVAKARSASSTKPRKAGDYLALGDSIVFGAVPDAPNGYGNAADFVGWPSAVADHYDLRLTNAACPGQATGSFIRLSSKDDYGCRPYRKQYPLHVRYSGSQFQFAKRFLRTHRQTRLVSIGIGINDIERMRRACHFATECVNSDMPSTLQTLSKNMRIIIRGLRSTGYRGLIVIADQYATLGPSNANMYIIRELDEAMARSARALHVPLANVYASFYKDDGPDHDSACAAGLLYHPSAYRNCDFHPSAKGQRLIARTVDGVLGRPPALRSVSSSY